jgi:hypothetical protein
MERLVQEDLDRSNAKRDLQWKREELAREQLLKDVYQIRGAQIQEKLAKVAQSSSNLALEKEAAEAEILQAARDQAREEKDEREAILRRRADLESQISINRHRQVLEKQFLEQEKAVARAADVVYQQKLEKFRQSSIDNAKRNYGIRSTTS